MKIEIKLPDDLPLDGFEDEIEKAIAATLKGAAQLIANDAKRAVQRGPKTGRVYRRGGITHQASSPGEAPATDHGVLVGSIVADAEGLRAIVEARAEYAVHLEHGTRRMAPRPFLFPAAERNKQRILALIGAALESGAAAWRQKRGR